METPEYGLHLMAAEIYALYPRKVKRKAAIAAIIKAFKSKRIDYHKLRSAVIEYAKSQEGRPKEQRRFIPHCSTWVNGEQWSDERSEWTCWKDGDGKQRKPPGRVKQSAGDFGDLF